ncbi:MAG TPA: PilZ domain-containing protein [Nitrospiraceae bacterium]|nr:PilZ domain-containing protein [Nitrospiraceae bacterium]
MVDDRREWLRIDDCLFLEYQLVGELTCPVSFPGNRAAEELITTFITKPTEDFLAAHPHEAEPVLVPWLKKIDWVLESILQRLVRMSKEGIVLPKRTDVNISGGGISFITPRQFQEHDQLDLRVILPPFTPIQARVEIIRVIAMEGKSGTDGWYTATRFMQITQDDHECLIRHILHTQAERLRARHAMQDAAD